MGVEIGDIEIGVVESGEAGRIEIVPPAAEHHNSELLIGLLSSHSYLRPARSRRRGIYIPAEMWYPVPNGTDRAGTARPT